MLPSCVWNLLPVRHPYDETAACRKAHPLEGTLACKVLVAVITGVPGAKVFVLPASAENVSLTPPVELK